MKRKAIPALCAAGLLALALTGCGGGTAGGQAEYIGIDAAKAVALEAAGVAEDDAVFSTAGLDKRNGMDYYAVDFTAGGQSYEYDIDAVTGVVIDSSSGGGTAETPAAETTTARRPPRRPPAPAPRPGRPPGARPRRHRGAGQGDRLSHAGLTADQVTFVRSKLDRDDGRLMYDVEFYTSDYKEYDYEIDAATGEILSYDYDAEGYSNQPNATPAPPSRRSRPGPSPWRRCPAPRRATSMSSRPTGMTAAWSTRARSSTTTRSMSSPSTATAAPSGSGTPSPPLVTPQQPETRSFTVQKQGGKKL